LRSFERGNRNDTRSNIGSEDTELAGIFAMGVAIGILTARVLGYSDLPAGLPIGLLALGLAANLIAASKSKRA
jgi:hypothetical protein